MCELYTVVVEPAHEQIPPVPVPHTTLNDVAYLKILFDDSTLNFADLVVETTRCEHLVVTSTTRWATVRPWGSTDEYSIEICVQRRS